MSSAGTVVPDGAVVEVVSCANEIDGLVQELAEIDLRKVRCRVVLHCPAGLKHLLHGSQQPVGVGEHYVVKFVPLFIGQIS